MSSKHLFLYSPGGENEGGSFTLENNDDKVLGNEQSDDLKDKNIPKKTVLDKVKDALQDWSNDDQQDQAFDDTRP